jgi:hypothetical protein
MDEKIVYEHEKLVIFGYPRSGTKLLANALWQNGYHNFGEFFNTYSAEIVLGYKTHAKRMSLERQKQLHEIRLAKPSFDQIKHAKDSEERLALYNRNSDLSPSVVTVWPETFELIPGMFYHLKDKYFLCTTRKNKFEQFLSRLLTYYNCNYDGEIVSEPIEIEMHIVEVLYASFVKTEYMQNEIVRLGLGEYVDFDDLIAGKPVLGFNYRVTTEDQHADIKAYIKNIDEVKAKVNELKEKNLRIHNFMVIE